MGLRPLYSLGRTSLIVIILPFVVRLPGGIGLDYTVSPPLLLVSWFLHFIFSCRRSFLLVFMSFSSIVVVYK